MAKNNRPPFKSIVQQIIIVILSMYRYLISPLLGHCCRYYPSCSQYAADAIKKHGIFSGGWLALKRLSRCHPFNSGGYDPVPEKSNRESL